MFSSMTITGRLSVGGEFHATIKIYILFLQKQVVLLNLALGLKFKLSVLKQTKSSL